MEENKEDKKPHVIIGVIGHVGNGKAQLNEAIEKLLKEGKKTKKEKTKDKSKLTFKHEIFVDDSDNVKLDI